MYFVFVYIVLGLSACTSSANGSNDNEGAVEHEISRISGALTHYDVLGGK